MFARTLRCLPLALLVPLAACSDDGGTKATDTPAGTTTAASTGEAVFGAEQFAIDSQFVQFESMSGLWRLHLLAGIHTCDEDLASLSPAVGVDFQDDGQSATQTPSAGALDEPVTFISSSHEIAPLTTTVGVTLQLDTVSGTSGDTWTGHLTVDADTTADGIAYAFDGTINATVCPAV